PTSTADTRVPTKRSHHSLFFFSSRRRHTRSKRDWSSDVCSSDLNWHKRSNSNSALSLPGTYHLSPHLHTIYNHYHRFALKLKIEIGRASCRERGKTSLGDAPLWKVRRPQLQHGTGELTTAHLEST